MQSGCARLAQFSQQAPLLCSMASASENQRGLQILAADSPRSQGLANLAFALSSSLISPQSWCPAAIQLGAGNSLEIHLRALRGMRAKIWSKTRKGSVFTVLRGGWELSRSIYIYI